MKESRIFLRHASPNELRTISREDLGFYHAVIIGGIYRFTDGFSVESPQSFSGPLKRCIDDHPFLSVVVANKHTDRAFYERVPSINLAQHVEIREPLDDDKDWTNRVEELMEADLDRPFPDGIPPWRIVMIPFAAQRRFFIAFEYSHAIGDGPSGLAFHRSFLSALRQTPTLSSTPNPNNTQPGAIIPSQATTPLPAPFDTPSRLPISLSFLLAPLLAALLPTFLANLLGLKAQASTLDEGTWTPTPCFFDPELGVPSRAVIRNVRAVDVQKVVRAARERGAKLTGAMHVVIVRALARVIGEGSKGKGKGKRVVTNFVSTTAINMRKSIGASEDEMGEFASGVYLSHPLPSSNAKEEREASGGLTEEEWGAAKVATEKFAEAATRLRDQPIGLLRFVPSIRGWLKGKIGQRRDASYELSNVGVFDPGEGDKVGIEEMVFGQPGHVTSHAINFNVVSSKGGGLVVCITWPTGALGLGEGEEEGRFVERVGDGFVKGFESLF